MKTFKIKTSRGEKIWVYGNWECLPDCGLCCEDHIAFLPRILKTHKKDMQRTVIREERFGDHVIAHTEDAICVFLKPDKRCAIYKLRPVVCRSYGRSTAMQCPFIDPMGVLQDEDMKFVLLEKFRQTRLARLAQGSRVSKDGV